MNNYLLVLCNMPDVTSARKLAKILLADKLCACVNLLPKVESLYLWEDKIEEASETTMLLKTTHDKYGRLEDMIRHNHPYQIPEIISLDIKNGLPEYLAWLKAATQ